MATRKRRGGKAAPMTPDTTSRRRSQRIGSSSKKSHYFESDSGSDGEADEGRVSKRAKTSSSGRKAGRRGPKAESDDNDDYEAPNEDDDEDEDNGGDEDDGNFDANEDSEEEVKVPKSHARGSHMKKNGKKAPNPADEASDSDSDASPKASFTPHKQLRPEGGVLYEDHRLHRNTLLFLADLKANNKRSWLKSNDAEYRRSLADWASFVDALTPKVVDADDSVPELPSKDVVFRIYRDIRFSKDPTPYKPHYSAAWSRSGRKGPYACYYLHCEPTPTPTKAGGGGGGRKKAEEQQQRDGYGGASFIGGGLWHPEAEALGRLRRSIDERPRRWRRVLANEAFRSTFLPRTRAGDEEGILKAFAASNKEGALKTKPKGFNPDHRDIELLKLRNFTIGKKIPNDYFTADDAQEKIAEIIGAMVGFITHLNSIVMPDGDEGDEDSDPDED